jgi:uncharacterized glyoxalase superfamily protein PhnB
MANSEVRGIHLFVRDVARSVAFYELAGIEFAYVGEHFARASGGRAALEIGSYDLTRGYDPGFREPPPGGSTAVQLGVDSREEVDAAFARMVTAGYEGHAAPFDAFWGARYAEVRDPMATWRASRALSMRPACRPRL